MISRSSVRQQIMKPGKKKRKLSKLNKKQRKKRRS
jgi:hypothetical protein